MWTTHLRSTLCRLAAGSCHVNADGNGITVKLRGKESTTTYTGVDGAVSLRKNA